jgi:hypothetical protein
MGNGNVLVVWNPNTGSCCSFWVYRPSDGKEQVTPSLPAGSQSTNLGQILPLDAPPGTLNLRGCCGGFRNKCECLATDAVDGGSR